MEPLGDRPSTQGDRTQPGPSNRELLLAHALPYFAYVAVLVLGVPLDPTAAYLAAGTIAGGLWLWRRSELSPLRGPGSATRSLLAGLAVGLLGTALWVGLLAPFLAFRTDPGTPATWPLCAILARASAAVLVVPLIEEQLMRGFVLGVAVQWQRAPVSGPMRRLEHALDHASIRALAPGTCGVFAAVVSSLVFAAGHAPHEWAAAFVYGALMSALYAARRDLLSCVIAHATTNATLALWVGVSGRFEYW